MARKFLDYVGLDYYDTKLKAYLTDQMNEGLGEALAQLSSALKVKGTISGTVDLTRYSNVSVGDTYFANGTTIVTYVDSNGETKTETLETSDAVICLVSSEATSSSVAVVQWGTLNTNWSVTNNNPAATFGSTAVVGTVGGVGLSFTMPTAAATVEALSDALDDKYLNFDTSQELNATTQQDIHTKLGLSSIVTKNETSTISDSATGDYIPTDLAVRAFVEGKIAESTNGVSDVKRTEQDDEGVWYNQTVVQSGIAYLPKIMMNGSALTEYRDFGSTAITSTAIITFGKLATMNTGSVASGATTTVPTGSTVYAYAANKNSEVASSSSSNGLTVTLGGTVSAPTVSLSFSGAGVTQDSQAFVTGTQVVSSLTGSTYFSEITDEEIDNLF